MAHSYKTDGPGGLAHVVLGTGILMAVALFGDFGGAARNALFGEEKPAPIRTAGGERSKCADNTVSTIIGTIGCGSTQQGAKLSSVTFLNAAKN
jgi:hypothetical protein